MNFPYSDLQTLFFSNNLLNIQKAIKMCQILSFRANLPYIVDLTYRFAIALSQPRNTLEFQTASCQAILRLVNTVIDQQQQNVSAQDRLPAHVLAAQFGIEKHIVDTRNQIAHGDIPSQADLRECCKECYKWLSVNFPQEPVVSYDFELDKATPNRLLTFFYENLMSARDVEFNTAPLQLFLQDLIKYKQDYQKIKLFNMSLFEYVCKGLHYQLLQVFTTLSDEQIQEITNNETMSALDDSNPRFPAIFAQTLNIIQAHVEISSAFKFILKQKQTFIEPQIIIQETNEKIFNVYDQNEPFDQTGVFRFGGNKFQKKEIKEEENGQFTQLDGEEETITKDMVIEELWK
ncbi:Las1-like_domain-containing protein [Hexamita inflata]|uniref:Las1-like_domain-containing protein n=1 Tax=Hexamita inflata TaxID=28002 RepID=A0ABP1HR71_9EUKA